MKQKSSLPYGKIGLAICLPIVVLLGLLKMWMNALNTVPQIQVPGHTMPAVNARDFFIKAADQEQSKSRADWALYTKHKTLNKDDHSYTDAEKAKIVADNATCLSTFRQGLAHPYMEPPIRSYGTRMPHLGKFRGLARLLRLEANTRATKGNYVGAVDSCLDAIQMGEMVPHGNTYYGNLDGIAITAIGERNCATYVPHLTAPQARNAAKRLEQMRILHVPYSEVLTEEKYAFQAGLIEIFNKSPSSFKSFQVVTGITTDGESTTDVRSRLHSVGQDIRYEFLNKRASLTSFTRYMDASIAAAKQPYPTKVAAIPIPNDVICKMVCIDFTRSIEFDRQAQAVTGMLELRLAIRAYELEHGHLPEKLEELVPEYITRLPDDTHVASGSYGYTRDKIGYTLFSKSGFVLPKLQMHTSKFAH